MKGDFTRFTFRPEKQYTSVRLQQGRVQLDADWNEQVDIHAYQMRVMQSSLFGDGAPRASAGFKVGFDTSRGLTLSPGRYIVGGLVCELPASASDASVGASDRSSRNRSATFSPTPGITRGRRNAVAARRTTRCRHLIARSHREHRLLRGQHHQQRRRALVRATGQPGWQVYWR